MAITPSGPDVPSALTERERRILAAIGEDLAAESAQLGEQLSAPAHWPVRRRGGAVDDVICVVAVLVVLGLLLPLAWFVVAVFIVAVTAPGLVARQWRRLGAWGRAVVCYRDVPLRGMVSGSAGTIEPTSGGWDERQRG